MANRNFNRKQALEKEVKEIYATGTFVYTAATATSDLTNDIIWTDAVPLGNARNTNTITIQVLAAAANPTNTILVTIGGSDAATTITVTPNDGTNNAATPVNLTTANLVELINTGAVTGKTVTLTDSGSRRTRQTATGGGAQNLADGGEGDGVVATFSGGAVGTSLTSKLGISSIVQSATGQFDVTFEDKWYALKFAKMKFKKTTGEDIRMQIKSDSVTSGSLVIFTVTGATATNPSNGLPFYVRFDLKNTNQT